MQASPAPTEAPDTHGRHVRLERSPARRAAYFAGGTISLVSGLVGVIVPGWPTTCFLLLAAWCYARSSERAYRWMHTNRFFGETLRRYREDGTVPARVKRSSLSLLWLTLVVSLALLPANVWIWALLLAVGLGVTWHVGRLPESRTVTCPVHAHERVELRGAAEEA